MHPRLLARDNCSGGSCPAVYGDDPGLQPDELAIVGKTPGAGLAARLADKIAGDEAAIIISRQLVETALRPPAREIGGSELQALFDGFRYTAFRLETLQHYAGTARDEEWIDHLRSALRWGKSHQRVHVVTEPLTAAMQQELTEGYEGNVAAGEDIRILPVAEGDWPAGVPQHDFWLFDSAFILLMQYDPEGNWTGAMRVDDPGQVLAACQARDAALSRAIPWRTYVASRPELQHRLAQ